METARYYYDEGSGFPCKDWVGFEGSIEINFYGLYKDYIGFVFH